MADGLRYRHIDTGAIPPADRFDYWRAMVAPLKLEPANRIPRDFRVSAESLSDGNAGVIEMDRGPATASWSREVGLAQGRLRLVVLAAADGAAAHWYGRDVPLTGGAAVLLGATDGWWRVPVRMRGIEVDLPRAAVPVSDTELAAINARRRLAADPVYGSLVRPALVGMAGHLEQLAATRLDGLAEVWTSLITMLIGSVSGNGAGNAELAPAGACRPVGSSLTTWPTPASAPTRWQPRCTSPGAACMQHWIPTTAASPPRSAGPGWPQRDPSWPTRPIDARSPTSPPR